MSDDSATRLTVDGFRNNLKTNRLQFSDFIPVYPSLPRELGENSGRTRGELGEKSGRTRGELGENSGTPRGPTLRG
jgi:hypothetical protein